MAGVTQLLEKLGLVSTDGMSPSDSPATAPQGESDSPESLLPDRPIPAPEILPPSPDSSDLTVDVERIYEKAGIKAPAHGFTVLKLIEMMNAEEFRGMDGGTLAKFFAGILKGLPGGPVPFADIIRDARDRDKALDEYDAAYSRKVAEEEIALREENMKLMAEIEDLKKKTQEQIDGNQQRIAETKAQLAAWRRKKETEESRLYNALAPFITSENPISLSRPSS